MKLRRWGLEAGGLQSRSVWECGGKQGATPLSDANRSERWPPCRRALSARSRTLQSVIGLGLLTGALCLRTLGQSYSIDWHTIDNGGGNSSGGSYSLSGTIGQHDGSSPMTGGNYSLTGGFWALYAVQTPGAPTLNIVPATPGHATVSWTPDAPGWVLQETLNLSSTNWMNSASGSTNPVVVPVNSAAKFYRLHKP